MRLLVVAVRISSFSLARSKVGWILSFGEQRLVRSRNADEAGRRTLRRNQYYILEGWGDFEK